MAKSLGLTLCRSRKASGGLHRSSGTTLCRSGATWLVRLLPAQPTGSISAQTERHRSIDSVRPPSATHDLALLLNNLRPAAQFRRLHAWIGDEEYARLSVAHAGISPLARVEYLRKPLSGRMTLRKRPNRSIEVETRRCRSPLPSAGCCRCLRCLESSWSWSQPTGGAIAGVDRQLGHGALFPSGTNAPKPGAGTMPMTRSIAFTGPFGANLFA